MGCFYRIYWNINIYIYPLIYIYTYVTNNIKCGCVCKVGCAQTVDKSWNLEVYPDRRVRTHVFCCLCPIARAPSWDTEWTVAASGVSGRTPLHLDWTPTPCMGWPRSKKGSWNTGRTRNDAWNDTYLRAETVWKGGKIYMIWHLSDLGLQG